MPSIKPNLKRSANAIHLKLGELYPNATCELDFKTPYQLLVATVLSAQCTDKRVNIVTPVLFKKFPTPQKMSAASLLEISEIIRSTGFYRVKANNIKLLSQKIVAEFDGKVPADLNQLITLPGVGRKTANVVLGYAFNIPGLTVDTHFGRLSRRFGWSESEDPVKVEHEVAELIAQPEWTKLSQRLIWHGRRVCFARNPACGACKIAKHCKSFGIGETDKIKSLSMVKTDSEFR